MRDHHSTKSYKILTCPSDDVIWVTGLVEDKYRHHRDSEGNNTMHTGTSL